MAGKNDDIIELIIEGKDEYSDVSESVRAELGALAAKTRESADALQSLEKSLDLADTYRAQEEEVSRLARAQAEAKIEVDRLAKANKDAKGQNVELVEQLAKARAELGSVRTATNRAQKAFDATKDSMRRFGVDLKEVEANQEDYRRTTEKLGTELNDLALAQTNLVRTAREEAEAAREAAAAKAQQAEEEKRLADALEKQKQEAAEAAEQQRRIQEETDNYRRSLNQLVGNLRDGKITWEQYRIQAEKAADSVELSRKEIGKIRRAFEEQAVSAREYAREQAKLIEQQKAQADADRQLEEQQRRTREQSERYTHTIRQLTDEVKSGNLSWEDYRRQATDAARATDLSRKQIAQLNQELAERVTAARLAAEASARQAAEEKRVEDATRRYRVELDKLADTYKQGKVSADDFAKSEERIRQKLNLTEEQVEATRHELKAYTNQMKVVPVEQSKAGKSTDALTHATRRLAQAYTVLLAAQKASELGAGGYRAYTETENAMLGLGKTTTLTAAELQGLAEQMEHLSEDVTPTTKVELLAVAEAAGRMGVEGAQNIAAFTKSIDALSSATGLAGDDVAQAIAQILNVTGEAQKNVVGVSAAIADLGNNTATAEADIVHFAKRLASDTATVRLSSAEVLGLSSSLAEMGLQAEGAGTVVGRTFRFIEDAVKSGGKPMEDLIRITGKSEEALVKAFGEDKIGLFSDFLAGLNRIQDGGATLNGILEDLGIKSDENARILGLLSQRYELLNENVEVSNKAFETGTAHFEEMAKKAAALESGFTRLQNRVHSLQERFGEAFSDDLMRAIDNMARGGDDLDAEFAELGETAADLLETLGGLIGAFDSLVAGLLGPISEIGVFNGLITGASMNIDAVVASINFLVGGVAELGIAWNKFFGDQDDIEYWTKTQEEAFRRTNEAIGRYNDNLERLNGKSSRAFQDLRDTYNQYRDALSRMDEEQRQAAETILNTTGYIEGNDAVYRQLTRAIQRAAEEKRIFTEYTKEENTELNSHIELLKAQGIEEAEAIRLSKEKLEARRQEREAAEQAKLAAEEERKEAERKRAEEQKQVEEQGKATEQALKDQSDAWKALGLDIAEVTESISEQGKEAVDSFELIAKSGQYSAEQIRKAFDSALSKAKTKADIEALIDALERAKKAGQLTGKAFRDAFEAARDKIKGVERDTKKATDEVDDFNDTLEETGKAGTGSIGALTKAIRELIGEVQKLAEGYRDAADEAERMAQAGEGAQRAQPGPGTDPDYNPNAKSRRSVQSQIADRLYAQGRGDAAEILLRNIANGQVPTSPQQGLTGWQDWWDEMERTAVTAADDIRRQRDDFARIQRDIAAGNEQVAKQFLQQRERYANLEHIDLTGTVAAAAALANKQQQQPQPEPRAPEQRPSASTLVRIEFPRNGRNFHLDGEPEAVQALLDNLVEVGATTR